MDVTRDHAEIRLWATRHGALPVEAIIHTFDSQPSALRFVFGADAAAYPDLKRIGWDDFFARFDLMGLALLYDDSPHFELIRGEQDPALLRMAN